MKKFLPALTIALFSTTAFAEPGGPRVLVETDPVTFAMSGYSAHVRFPLENSGLVLGAGLYGMRLPDFVAELHPDNEGQRFHAEIDKSYAGFLDYHFTGRPEGLFAGVQVALQRHRITQGDSPAANEVGVALLMPRLGYLYRPFSESGFYVLPWVGAGAAVEVYRTNTVAADYESLPVLAFGSLHVGYAF